MAVGVCHRARRNGTCGVRAVYPRSGHSLGGQSSARRSDREEIGSRSRSAARGACEFLPCDPQFEPLLVRGLILERVDLLRSSRRHFLATQSLSIGGLALAWLFKEEQAQAKPTRPELGLPRFSLEPKATPHAPRAKAMI